MQIGADVKPVFFFLIWEIGVGGGRVQNPPIRCGK
jgi:hypothetical protein